MQKNHPALLTFHFENGSNHEVRTILKEDGSIWFVAKDVCDVLHLKNVSKALYGLDPDEKSTLTFGKGILSGNPKRNIISESGLYALVLRSNKPDARPFRKWVTSEVLPSIRQTGAYAVGEKPKRSHEQPDVTLQEVASFLKATTDAYWHTYRAIGTHRAIESELKKTSKAIVAILDSIKTVFPESKGILDDIEGRSMDESRGGMPLPVESHGIKY